MVTFSLCGSTQHVQVLLSTQLVQVVDILCKRIPGRTRRKKNDMTPDMVCGHSVWPSSGKGRTRHRWSNLARLSPQNSAGWQLNIVNDLEIPFLWRNLCIWKMWDNALFTQPHTSNLILWEIHNKISANFPPHNYAITVWRRHDENEEGKERSRSGINERQSVVSRVQGWTKRWSLGLVNFCPCCSCFCLKLPAAFSQPGVHF